MPLPRDPRWRGKQPSLPQAALSGLLAILLPLTTGPTAQAGDILRGGTAVGSRTGGAPPVNNPGAAEAARAAASARDALGRTTQALQAVKAAQNAARAAAQRRNNLGQNPNAPGQLPNVRNGLGPGGLQVAPGVPVDLTSPSAGEDPSLWIGANLPNQTVKNRETIVTIKQTAPQAFLNWETFNVGSETTLRFDQRAGGSDVGKWIAFNKVMDPSGVPSQILGSIEAPGQVYVINQNGIMFGGGSQVNVNGLVASSLPINTNLLGRKGLLNNRDSQFLFSALPMPGGSDGTPAFTPPASTTPSGKSADVRVMPGAVLQTPSSTDGNGGRVMLVGANVINEGSIRTEAGQTILAAGLQVGITAHASDDPSLRGLDVWIGDVGTDAGTATNRGVIEALTGSIWMAGRNVNQFGVLESSTSVNLNGRIDLVASYGAVANPNFDNPGLVGSGGPPFLYQHTGAITFGRNSVTRILPDYASTRSVPGTRLPEQSQINAEALSVYFAPNAMMLAPNGDVSIRAGVYPYQDLDGNRTVFDLDGQPEGNLASFFSGATQRFLFSSGQIYVDDAAFINVAGSTDVFVPLAQSILNVELRGTEFADSPLQRGGALSAIPLTVDLRRTGVYNGRFWMGTPLGDVTGLAGLIERNAAQLTAAGGNVSLRAGGSVVVQNEAKIDVSGGFFDHEGGLVKTTRLLQDGRLVDIRNALPDQTFDGIYTGEFTTMHSRWGVSETFAVPFMTGERWEEGYVQGAAGGSLAITAPSMAVDGELRGLTVRGERQRSSAPELSSLSLSWTAEKIFEAPGILSFLKNSPTPPDIVFANSSSQLPAKAFELNGGSPVALDADRIAAVVLSPKLLGGDGFGHLSIENPDGNITVPEGVTLTAPERGSITLAGANVAVGGVVSAPGGDLRFTTFNISPTAALEFPLLHPQGALAPTPNADRGLFSLAAGATLSAAGLIIDDRRGAPAPLSNPLVLDGGTVTINSFNALLADGSSIDVSGGVGVDTRGEISYGDGGSITILTGKDPGFNRVIGGELVLGSTLRGYSGTTGGALSIQASLIQIGGLATVPNTLLLQPEFFRQGGFTSYSLAGIGASAGGPDDYTPGVLIAPGTRIEPVAESSLALPNNATGEVLLTRMLKPVGQRAPVSLSFSASGADDSFTDDILEVRGDVVMGRGAEIVTDPGARVSFNGQTVSLLGSVFAPGGSISVTGASRFPVPVSQRSSVAAAEVTVYLGSQAELSTTGAVLRTPDAFGRHLGTVLPGGTISIAGNILAERGSLLDVSGTSEILDVHPSLLGQFSTPIVPATSGLTSPLWSTLAVATPIASHGGSIILSGSELLLSDATLLGHAGGPTAVGGSLSVGSGRFYAAGAAQFGSDINLVVKQSGWVVNGSENGVGRPALDASGAALPGMGYFAVDRFSRGGFESLDLGYTSLNAAGLSAGGNVEFDGPVSIHAPGSLRVAAGGVIKTGDQVLLRASYVSLGQIFQLPLNPDDAPIPFRQNDPANPGGQQFVAPTFGTGSLRVLAEVIDVGTLLFQDVGKVALTAHNGDIRGNGILSLAGDLKLTAAQVYPTTLSAFDIFVYDHAGTAGSVTIAQADSAPTPLSAGGSLRIFASDITQGGTLRAPVGSIILGWDGTDFDPSDADLDLPRNAVSGSTIAAPVTDTVRLQTGSLTSVAAISTDGSPMIIPYGLSPDGTSWIDPRGENVTVTGLASKQILLAGDSIRTARGSVIDIRGGGDLSAYRFVPGIGGSLDLLGSASADWSGTSEYQPGDLVSFGGATWSARVRHTGETPNASLYWTRVPEAFALLPNFDSSLAPYAPFNTGPNAGPLGGDRGYVNANLTWGDRIYLDGSSDLDAGAYTLLPQRYALLPGAFLITPVAGAPIGSVDLPGGESYASGYRFNQFSQPDETLGLRSRFLVSSSDDVRLRATYDDYSANTFLAEAASRLNVENPQRLAIDAGYLAIHGNAALQLANSVLATQPQGGRGAFADLSSFADITITGAGNAPANSSAVLQGYRLNSWGVESLLVGGLRRFGADGTTVDVRTSNLTLDNPRESLFGPEIILASDRALTMTSGSSLRSRGRMSGAADSLRITGDGTLIRVSGDLHASVTRTGVTGSAEPLLTIGASASIGGRSVFLDSTYGTSLDPAANIVAQALTLGSGQISIVLEEPAGGLSGSVVDPHLVLAGQILADVQGSKRLTLQSYRTIDIYGSGLFGNNALDMRLFAGGIRGFDQDAGMAAFTARDVLFSNPSNSANLAEPAATSGALQFNAQTIALGSNAFAVAGYENLLLNATSSFIAQGSGSFSTGGNLTITTPVITGGQGAKQAITAAGAIVLESSGEPAGVATTALGASLSFTGTSIAANTTVLLPSGELTLRATSGDTTVGGDLDVAGIRREFYDLIRYSDAGVITLAADAGNVSLLAGSSVSVAAPAGGGDAGTLIVKAPGGIFISDGVLRGSADAKKNAGSFVLDVGSLTSYAGLNDGLEKGGFTFERDIRIRVGSVVVDAATTARTFALSTDTGSITLRNRIDASGSIANGSIALVAGGDLVLESGAVLDASGEHFSSAGKGGDVRLEAGSAFNGTPNLAAMLDLQTGATIDLGVADYVAGDYTTPGSSAFYGQFTGTLHLRAPRNATNSDLNISAINSTITGASSIVAEGYHVVDLTTSGGLITGWRTNQAALPAPGTVQRAVYDSAAAFLSAPNYTAMTARLLGLDAQGLLPNFVLAPGAEIINRNGNLTLGLENGTSLGTASRPSGDWNLSDFRFGPKQAPGILTLRASEDIVFNNALSDGFTPVAATAANGNSQLWLGQLKNLDPLLPVNTQSWSYRLIAGADLSAASSSQVRDPAALGDSGSIFVGQFYPPVPNQNTGAPSPAVGTDGQTANTIRISTTGADLGTRFEVVRTGTGSITMKAGRDVQLRNQFATIYTAGVRLPEPQNIFAANDFRAPSFFFSGATHPNQGSLGAPQQYYGPIFVDETGVNRRTGQWAFAGGEVAIEAARNIGRYYGLDASGNPLADSSRQLPGNWLSRRGYVDPSTGLFGAISVDGMTDPSASTAWWIDYSNFFQGIGALGGGDVSLVAGQDIVNTDAVLPTNARMAGRDPVTGLNIGPDPAKLLEHGGGDLFIKAGNNIDGGVYYVERGAGTLSAGGVITTNSARSPSFGILRQGEPEVFDSRTWLPTTLFAGKSQFDVSARGDILLGPVLNAFLLPAGLNNKPWYRTYFSTYSADAGVDVSSFGGSITHRLAITLPGRTLAQPIMSAWLEKQNFFTEADQGARSSYFQPWIRLAEYDVQSFATSATIQPPTLRSTAFDGDVNIVGAMNLFPSPTGTLELAAAGGVVGLQQTGIGRAPVGADAVSWASASVNISDADPASINGIANPSGVLPGGLNFLSEIFAETGSFTGANASAEVKRFLHADGILHANDADPVRVYATGGDINGLTLFSPKQAKIHAHRDITDIAFYLQNANDESISAVSAGRDIIPFNENSTVRSIAGDLTRGNFIADPPRGTVVTQGNSTVTTTALAGDIQISGPGALEVIAGRDLDLGTGANLADGTGVGITSIGNFRNPFLPFDGADLVLLAGVGDGSRGPALSLSSSDLDFEAFVEKFLTSGGAYGSRYLPELGAVMDDVDDPESAFSQMPKEKQALLAMKVFYRVLRDAGRDQSASLTGIGNSATAPVIGPADYAAGFEAIDALFGDNEREGEIFARARDIRTSTGGDILIAAPSGGLTLASDVFGNPLTPPGVVTEAGGSISIFTDANVDIGQARIFTLRGGDIVIWSSTGNIAAGTSPKTVVTAPPTRVVIDVTSANVQTDLGGLATGGGIGVLAAVSGVEPGNVDLIAPVGVVDAGDAGIRSTGNLNIAATAVINASNIQVGGSTAGVPSAPTVAAPNIGSLTSASNTAGAATSAGENAARQAPTQAAPTEETPSIISVEVIGYGGGSGGEDEEEQLRRKKRAQEAAEAAT